MIANVSPGSIAPVRFTTARSLPLEGLIHWQMVLASFTSTKHESYSQTFGNPKWMDQREFRPNLFWARV